MTNPHPWRLCAIVGCFEEAVVHHCIRHEEEIERAEEWWR